MAKKRMNDLDISIALIDKMFEIAGHEVRFKDIDGRQDDWYRQWTMTEAQNKEWKEWGAKFIKTERRLNKAMAERQMQWFDLAYGLKISDWLQNHPEYGE